MAIASSTLPLAESRTSLSQQINIATRSLHTKLNKRILARLPLAIPPFSKTSSKYASGIYYITPIYMTFESLWQTIIDDPFHSHELSDQLPISESVESQTASPRTHSLLSFLLLPELLRSEVLQDDLQELTGGSEEDIDERLERISKQGNLGMFIEHMHGSIKQRPHVLLAYAWVLYMALFSGGRILRGILQAASGIGRTFWDRDLSPLRPVNTLDIPRNTKNNISGKDNIRRSRFKAQLSGLGFFSFPGTQDGEDIKTEFKKRYAEIELRLTDSERTDIVTEALHIFEFMLGIISDLDSVCGTSGADIETAKQFHKASKLGAIPTSVEKETKESQSHGKMDVLLSLLHIKEALPPSNFSANHPVASMAVETPPPSATTEEQLGHVNEPNMFWLKGAAMLVPVFGVMIVFSALYLCGQVTT